MLLRQLIAKHGARNWSVIANGIRGRSGKSCRLRWCNQLNPCVKKEPFSEEEDAKIVQACSIAKIGPSLAPLLLTSRLGPHRRTRSTATNGLSSHARCRAGQCAARTPQQTTPLMPSAPFDNRTDNSIKNHWCVLKRSGVQFWILDSRMAPHPQEFHAQAQVPTDGARAAEVGH